MLQSWCLWFNHLCRDLVFKTSWQSPIYCWFRLPRGCFSSAPASCKEELGRQWMRYRAVEKVLENDNICGLWWNTTLDQQSNVSPCHYRNQCLPAERKLESKYPFILGSPFATLLWRHNERDGVSNHQPPDCLLNRLFRRRSKKTSKLRVIGLCEGEFTGDRWIPRTKGQ